MSQPSQLKLPFLCDYFIESLANFILSFCLKIFIGTVWQNCYILSNLKKNKNLSKTDLLSFANRTMLKSIIIISLIIVLMYMQSFPLINFFKYVQNHVVMCGFSVILEA